MKPDEMDPEILQRAGRNLIAYQQLEVMLKALLDFGQLSVAGDASGAELLPRRDIWTDTLGQVIASFVGSHCSAKAPRYVDPDPGKVVLAFSFNLNFNFDIAAELDSIRVTRNEFVHKFFVSGHMISAGGQAAAVEQLDKDYKVTLQMLAQLRDLCRGALKLLEFSKTPEFWEGIDRAECQASPVINHLDKLAADGAWRSLHEACQELGEGSSEMIREDYSRLGKKTLTDLGKGSALFETKKEPGDHGGMWTYYRKIPGLTSYQIAWPEPVCIGWDEAV